MEGPPFGNISVAGYIQQSDSTEIIFDYSIGAITTVPRQGLAPMTPEILEKSPISLWNVKLEIHTGRIFQSLVGDYYILIVPLVGLFSLVILITGFLVWWLRKKIPSPVVQVRGLRKLLRISVPFNNF
jgi:uncharacterized iron-regulated membrane protein